MKGICFKEPLFHAAVNGTKTQTRRIIKEQPKGMLFENLIDGRAYFGGSEYAKPKYQVGETVYLKEPYYGIRPNKENGELIRGFNFNLLYEYNGDVIHEYEKKFNPKLKFKNKLFMPAKYARYFIEITAVRCERLQDISDEDCMKEGIYLDYIEQGFFHYHDPENRYYCDECEETGRERLIKEALDDRDSFGFDGIDDEWIKEELNAYSMDDYSEEYKGCDICGKTLSAFKYPGYEDTFCDPHEAYAALIDKINGKGTWDSNPYVWVYDFKLLKNK